MHESPAAILCRNEYTLIGTIRFAQWLHLFDTLVQHSWNKISFYTTFSMLASVNFRYLRGIVLRFISINLRQLYQKLSRPIKYVRYGTIKPLC